MKIETDAEALERLVGLLNMNMANESTAMSRMKQAETSMSNAYQAVQDIRDRINKASTKLLCATSSDERSAAAKEVGQASEDMVVAKKDENKAMSEHGTATALLKTARKEVGSARSLVKKVLSRLGAEDRFLNPDAGIGGDEPLEPWRQVASDASGAV